MRCCEYGTGSQSHKTFCCKFTRSFIKLDRFINVINIVSVKLNYVAYHKVLEYLGQKGFIRSTPGACTIKLITAVIYVFL